MDSPVHAAARFTMIHLFSYVAAFDYGLYC
jgi:hypothetical protein